jgi:hypothetical protein
MNTGTRRLSIHLTIYLEIMPEIMTHRFQSTINRVQIFPGKPLPL